MSLAVTSQRAPSIGTIIITWISPVANRESTKTSQRVRRELYISSRAWRHKWWHKRGLSTTSPNIILVSVAIFVNLKYSHNCLVYMFYNIYQRHCKFWQPYAIHIQVASKVLHKLHIHVWMDIYIYIYMICRTFDANFIQSCTCAMYVTAIIYTDIYLNFLHDAYTTHPHTRNKSYRQ